MQSVLATDIAKIVKVSGTQSFFFFFKLDNQNHTTLICDVSEICGHNNLLLAKMLVVEN